MAMNWMRAAAAVLALVAAMPAAGTPYRDRQPERERRQERARQEGAISLDEAVARAERRYKARAVRTSVERHGDRIQYRIRLLARDGRVFEVRVDAQTGRED